MSTSKRGFASMDPARQREIASMGGKATTSRFRVGDNRASESGRKGGALSGGQFKAGEQRAVEAGRKGAAAKASKGKLP